ncbi:hypothetical protein V1517DRAFT_326175 [Lipomyces orientalis]|uniref:Uncharacterized protein n=1 Tax=Lipomyces orientalis TaxID=1233043 RepID=A0ACC3TK13_9ASCO
MARNFSDPSEIYEISTRPGNPWSVIPLTRAENEVAKSPNWRFRLTPHTHGAVINETSAIQFWDISACSGSCEKNAGTTLIIYTFDSDTNTLTVSRPARVYQRFLKNYPYGSFAALTVQGTTYLYSWDPYSTSDENYDGWQRDIHVASAPASSVEDKTTWRYYNNGTGTWSSTEPLPTPRRLSAAILSLDDPPLGNKLDYFLSGSIFYSAYHDAYLLVYVSTQYLYFRVRYAPTPVGPWSQEGIIIWDPSSGFGGLDPTFGLASPVFSQTDDGSLGGKSLLLNLGTSPGSGDILTFNLTFV